MFLNVNQHKKNNLDSQPKKLNFLKITVEEAQNYTQLLQCSCKQKINLKDECKIRRKVRGKCKLKSKSGWLFLTSNVGVALK